MIQKATLVILAIFGCLTLTTKAQQAQVVPQYNGYQAACVANGYGYCESSQICFVDSTLPSPLPEWSADWGVEQSIQASIGCQSNSYFATNQTHKSWDAAPSPNEPTVGDNCEQTSCGSNCDQIICYNSCGDNCVQKTCQIKNNTKFYHNCANDTCYAPCTEKCELTACEGANCTRSECTTLCGSVDLSNPCAADNCTITNETSSGVFDTYECPPPCTEDQCVPSCYNTSCGEGCVQSTCTTCAPAPICTPYEEACVQYQEINGVLTSGECNCDWACSPTDPITSTCAGSDCTQTNQTICNAWPDCGVQDTCQQVNCTANGCKTQDCVWVPTCDNTNTCFEECVSSSCAGDDCTQTDCSVCGSYPGCDYSTNCTQTNCTADGICTTVDCPPPTCESESLCVESCVTTTCAGRNCNQIDCIACEEWPSCAASANCTFTNCTRRGCTTSTCPTPTCDDIQSTCVESCSNSTCVGPNCIQTNCTVCNTYPDCGELQTCSIYNCTEDGVCSNSECVWIPTCENTDVCVESCTDTPCIGDSCVETNCVACDDYPTCTPTTNCTQTNGTNTIACSDFTCENQYLCIESNHTESCEGTDCTQTTLFGCGAYPLCAAQTPVCSQTNLTEDGTYVTQDCPNCQNTGACITGPTTVACEGRNCNQTTIRTCSSYPDCTPTDVCTQTNCTRKGCKTIACPPEPTCENQGLCVEATTGSACVGDNCIQQTVTTCGAYPDCIQQDTCTQTNCTADGTCSTGDCTPPATCENTGLCSTDCEVSFCEGYRCQINNCTTCSAYPACEQQNKCTFTNCTNRGCKTQDCPTCENSGLCFAQEYVTTACEGTDCTVVNGTTCSEFPSCQANIDCVITNCTADGVCTTTDCPVYEATCENHDLCYESSTSTACSGSNCTQTESVTCAEWPVCSSTATCVVYNCTENGCKTQDCPPPPTCENQGLCVESTTAQDCVGGNCFNYVECAAYPDCTATTVCFQTLEDGSFGDCGPEPDCANMGLCTDVCTDSTCAGPGRCTQTECTSCTIYPQCLPEYSCTQRKCTRAGCTNVDCETPAPADPCGACNTECVRTSCGDDCWQDECTTSCPVNKTCEAYNCTVYNNTLGYGLQMTCEEAQERQADPQIDCPPTATAQFCLQSACDIGQRCDQTNCVSFYNTDPTCITTNCTQEVCVDNVCQYEACDLVTEAQEPDCTANCQQYCEETACDEGEYCTYQTCVQACDYSFECGTNFCTTSNCTADGHCTEQTNFNSLSCPTGVWPPLGTYDCPVGHYNWQKPKALRPCDIGANGHLFLSDFTDVAGQIDATKQEVQYRQFWASPHEACSITIVNNEQRSGVRLAICDNTGFTLSRVQYPSTVTGVETLTGYYDVQSTDDVLLLTVASKETNMVEATFMWEPSPQPSEYQAIQEPQE